MENHEIAKNEVTVFINKFTVPRDSFAEFRDRMSVVQKFIETQTGLVSNETFESENEDGNFSVISIAKWKDTQNFERAKIAVQTHREKNGINQQELYQKLNVKFEVGVYRKA
jgi:heme-degrading monooxygenase HmoA